MTSALLLRRISWVALLAASAAACRAGGPSSGESPASTGAASDSKKPPSAPVPAEPPEVPALETVTVSDMPESERGGVAVVVLHGWGAAGDDLVSLARRLARPKSRFFVPAAPLPQGVDGRAWWHMGSGAGPAHAWDDQAPPDYRPKPQVLRARRAVQRLLRDVRERYAPERLALFGFSQGGMLSLDVALAADPAVDRVGVLSGVMLADSLAGLRAPHARRPSFFVSHGRSDQMLPFGAGESASKLLGKYGFPVTFLPFEGGHSIPPTVVTALGAFLFDGS